jgi:hypothetical protein
MRHRQDDTTAPDLSTCDTCEQDFVVPISVVDLLEDDRCLVELACNNCGTASLRVHTEEALMELDQRLDDAQGLMREAVEVLEIADELDRIDGFVRALRAGHVLPEDF